MVKGKSSKSKQPKAAKAPQEATASAEAGTRASAEVATPARKKAAKRKRRDRRATARKTKPRRRAKPAASKKAPKRRSRYGKRYTPAERAKILAAAKREDLSGPAAAKKFGISLLTFYTWRKKAGGATRKPAAVRSGRPRVDGRWQLAAQIDEKIRLEVRARVSELLPQIIQSEINTALGTTKPHQPRR